MNYQIVNKNTKIRYQNKSILLFCNLRRTTKIWGKEWCTINRDPTLSNV